MSDIPSLLRLAAVDRPAPPLARATVYLLFALVMFFILWASFGRMDVFVVASGKVITLEPTITLQPLETAQVRSIEVSAGQSVKRGQVLANLDPTFAEADQTQGESERRTLAAEEARLEAERTGTEYRPTTSPLSPEEVMQLDLFNRRQANFLAELRNADARVAQLKAKQRKNRDDISRLNKLVTVSSQVEAMRQELFTKEIGSKLQALKGQGDLQQSLREREQAINEQRSLAEELAQQEAQRETFITNWRRDIVESQVQVRKDLKAATEQLSKTSKRREAIQITTPVDAVVLEVGRYSTGSVIRQGDLLMTLIPTDVPLEVEIQILAKDIGYIRLGDPVRIKFDAFPFQKHGWANGKVRTISEDTFLFENKKDEPGQMVYRARIEIVSLDLKGLPAGFRLLPGLSVSSEIRVNRRRIITYFLYPIIRTLDESMREP